MFRPYTGPEDIEEMAARFEDAISEPLTSGDDLRAIDDRHIFDFEDGWRFHISLVQVGSHQFILACFGNWDRVPYPVDLKLAKAAVCFASITGNRYGDPEVVEVRPDMVLLKYELM